MDRLLKSVLSVGELKPHVDDDCVDRLSHRSTVVVLVCFAFVVSTKQFVGDPICCWCPAEFTPSQRHYANAVCWVSNTYYLPIDETIPSDVNLALLGPQHSRRVICYYQWVPLMLIFQAMMSFSPCLVWRFLNQRSGVNLNSIMGAARVCSETSYLQLREAAVRYIVNHIDRCLLAQRDHRTGCCVRIKQLVAKMCCLVGGRIYGNYLVTAYLSVKVLYLANAVGQIYLLESFLAVDYRWYGAHVVERLIRGLDWSPSDRFPRVTLCQFDVRHQSRVHYYVVQCTLTINLFNEKIFLVIWFWYVVVALVTFVSILSWLFRSLYWPGQVQYVRKQLLAVDKRHREPDVLVKFTENYLRRDGNFVLRLVAINMGHVVASEILCGLWSNYNPERRLAAEKPGRRRHSSTKWRLNGGKRVEII